jgi:hypothetical protein
MDYGKEFQNYYVNHLGKGSLDLHYHQQKIEASLTPYILAIGSPIILLFSPLMPSATSIVSQFQSSFQSRFSHLVQLNPLTSSTPIHALSIFHRFPCSTGLDQASPCILSPL